MNRRLTRRTFMKCAALGSCAAAGLQDAARPAAAAEEPRTAGDDPVGRSLGQSFIWLPSATTGTQAYVLFRKTFDLPTMPDAATLRIFADSRYILWVNGQYILRGPARFDPGAPEYDTADVKPHLLAGRNVIKVLVHHYSKGGSGRMVDHAPGLAARLEMLSPPDAPRVLETDATWQATRKTRFGPSPASWASIPDNVDARRDAGDSPAADVDETAWEAAAPVGGSAWGPLRPRSIPPLRESDVPLGAILRQVRSGRSDETWRPLSGALPLGMSAPYEVTIEMDQYVQAYVALALEAEEGSLLEVEPLGTGKVSRYVARGGPQVYVTADTFGFRRLAVRLGSGSGRLNGVRVINRLYPFDLAGSFRSSDGLLNRLWTACVRTVALCSEDAYVDCADRERVQRMGGAAVVAYPVTRIAFSGPGPDGKPAWGDARLMARLLRQIAQGRRADGRLKACHPSDRQDAAADGDENACLWVHALRQYWEHTGDAALVKEVWPALVGQMKWFLERRTARGLVKAREFIDPHNPLRGKECEGTAMNAFVLRALADAHEMARATGAREDAKTYFDAVVALHRAFNLHLGDPESGGYSGGILEDGSRHPPTVHATLLALDRGGVAADRLAAARRWLLANCEKQPLGLYTHSWLFEELYRMDTSETDLLALNLVRRRWEKMLSGDAGTTSEDFAGGSPCHVAGAVPAYFLSAYVLGVRPGGSKYGNRLLIEPHLGDLTLASGVTVTQRGPVAVSWKLDPDEPMLDFEFTVPEGAEARVAIPRVDAGATLVLDERVRYMPGAASPGVDVSARRLTVTVGPGRHTGQCRT
ncbi:MAG: hypothetical protein IMZ44_25180 [Planctomycetes bacterium]|nr:hypothetical protein [Planctomycetota bacterium]